MQKKTRPGDRLHVDLGRQQDIYESVSGDRPWFVGFDRRLAEWCEQHPRETLTLDVSLNAA